MANRIVGNVYVIDSQTGAANPLTITPGTASWLDNHLVSGFSFLGNDTTATIELVFAADTTATAYFCGHPNNNRNMTMTNLGEAVYFKELRCKTLTSGTGYIYFK